MLRNKMRSRKGFTLVELLVVIVIIAVLVAIALPRYYQAIYDSKVSTCKSNLKQIDLALHAYYAQLPATDRDWGTVYTNAGAGADMAAVEDGFASSTVFSGGFPACPFDVKYTAEEITNADGTVIGVQVNKGEHFEGDTWYDATKHVEEEY